MNWPDSTVPEDESWMPFYYEDNYEEIDNKEKERAPFVPLTIDTVNLLIPFMELKENDVLLDLGCGDGRVLIESLLQSPCNKAFGIDIDINAINMAKQRSQQCGFDENITLVCDDFFTTNSIPWNDISVVVMYLLPSVLDSLYPLLKKNLNKNCRIYCACFQFSTTLSYEIIKSRPFPELFQIKI
ncbi:Methyltransferase domain-containing protein [Entamoeba marina]